MKQLILVWVFYTQAVSYNVWNTFTSNARPTIKYNLDTEPNPVRVFTAGATMNTDVFNSLADSTSWSVMNGSSSIICTGLMRYGSVIDNIFSLPVVTNTSLECTPDAIEHYLWSTPGVEERESGSSCQCRRQLPLRLTLRGRCLAYPQTGWVSPGLVNCEEGQYMVGEWKYHPVSGQLRSGGKCLTAFPYNAKEKHSWRPWGVQMSDCLNYHDPMKRQSWSVPDGVGMALADPFGTQRVSSSEPPNNWAPSGHLGRVVSRDSWDIGARCLDISLSPQKIPTSLQVVFVEAPLCEDARIQSGDLGLWRFWISPNATKSDMDRSAKWEQCTDGSCTNCDTDDEFRGYWLPSAQNHSDTVSLPYGFNFDGIRCDIFAIRRLSVPPSLAEHAYNTCFCQEIPTINHWSAPKPGSIIWDGVNDLPTTKDPPLVQANLANATST